MGGEGQEASLKANNGDTPKPPLILGLGWGHSRTLTDQRRLVEMSRGRRPGKKAEKSIQRGRGDTKRRVF